ncbi:unnamed protein product [Calicophoron daubneyi]|uniref:3-hydroxyacyl-CoA dehydrogenase type-2 n=1 Tax=Calicophoron daubneyi TaxID=300641 RepID=A0AAV2TSP0_CALDB
MSLKGLSAIVTGGASGLGLATAKKLLTNGCKVLVCDLEKSPLFDDISKDCAYLQTDVTSESDALKAVSYVRKEFSNLNILVNCAGMAHACKIMNLKRNQPHSLDLFERTLKVNTTGTFNMIRFAAMSMAENEPDEDNLRGVIINTASIAAFEGQVGLVAYSASKAAVVGMTLPLARDLSREGIRVMAIAPGFFETPLLGNLTSTAHLVRCVVSPQRLGKAEEFAKLVMAIIENPMLNGEVIRLDGGARLPP